VIREPALSGDENISLRQGDCCLVVNPVRGARICVFSLEGRNILTGPEVDPDNFGSTFWTSPQSAWEWPPVPEVDHLPYAVVESGSALLCVGSLSQRLGVLVTKRFVPLPARAGFAVEYTVHNQTAKALRSAPWEISRVPGGLTLFATGQGRLPHPVLPETAVVERNGVTWCSYDRAQVKTDQKLFAHSNGGWLAHVVGRDVLIKEFPVVSPEQQAPGETVIELFASGLKDYVEIEQQGRYDAIAAWASSTWRVNWFLRRLPDGLDVSVGNSELSAWVQAALG
jgi:hypothetical protein